VIWRHSILLTFALLLAAVRCYATTYLIPPWEVQLDEADFVGVVECETAGPIISRYRVIEVWKGDIKTNSILVRNYYPVTYQTISSSLCGNIGLVTLKTSGTNDTRQFSNSKFTILSQIGVIPANFNGDSRFGYHRLEQRKGGGFDFSTNETLFQKKSFNETRAFSKKFCSKQEDERLIERLYVSVQKSIDREPDDAESRRVNSMMKRVAEKLKHTKTIEQAVDVFIKNPESISHSGIAFMYGGERLIALLEKKRSAVPEEFQIALEELRIYELGKNHQEEPAAIPSPPTDEVLTMAEQKWSSLHLSNLGLVIDNQAILLLSMHRPESMVKRLSTFEHSKNTHRIVKELVSYQLIRYFGMNCGTNRKHCLELLLESKDPIIRTGAAVYLCSEDLDQGMKTLEACAELPDVAGTWAAITLACRGQKSAMQRALRVFDFKGDPYNPELQSLWDKQGQLKALLSNSAKASGVPQPTAPYDAWWKKYGNKVTLHDPWLAEMDRLKID